MKNWMTPALAIVAVTTMSHGVLAQDKMAKPMGKEKTYTGCLATSDMAGTFTLTNPMAEMAMGGDAMKKDSMGKDSMTKPAMAKPIVIDSKAVDLSKHVGHKVSVTGPDSTMSKPDAMGKDNMSKGTPAWSVTSLKMLATTCAM